MRKNKLVVIHINNTDFYLTAYNWYCIDIDLQYEYATKFNWFSLILFKVLFFINGYNASYTILKYENFKQSTPKEKY